MDRAARKKLWKILSVIGLLAVIGLGLAGYFSGFYKDQEAIRAFLDRAGAWAPTVFLLLHFLQIIVPIVPGGAVLTMGVVFFGPVWGFVLNMIGICVGSAAAFFLARVLGRKFVEEFAEEEQIQKYEQKIAQGEKKFTVFFAIAIMIPFMPDDLLCMLAGLSGMPVRRFVLILIFCKIPSILAYSLGAAALIPH